ncbi:MAG: hypothetical protein R3C49_27695 [Planctomycetaceae bacterium]
MSTAIDRNGQYADCDEFIDHQLQTARRRIKWTDLLTAALLAGVLLVGYVLVFTVLDHWIVDGGFSAFTRMTLLITVLSVCMGILFRYVILPWSKTIHPLYAARMLDGSGSGLQGTLVSLVDLQTSSVTVSDTVRKTIERRAAVKLAKVNLDEAIDRSALMKLGLALLALLLLTCLYAVFSPKAISLLRPLTLTTAEVATRTRILKVDPGNTIIAAGEQLPIRVDLSGDLPERVLVLYTTEDKTYVDEALTMQATEQDGRLQVVLMGEPERGLRQNFSYRIEAGDATSEEFHVTVNQPPSANITELQYHFPQYMQLPDLITQNGNLAAWEGAEVQLTAEANTDLKSAVLKFSDTATFDTPAEEVPLQVDGRRVTGRMTLELRSDRSSPKFCRIEVRDTEGRTDPKPTVYAVNIRPDKPPVVKLLDPLNDLRVPANAIVPLLVEAEDPDFLLRSVKLEFEVNGEARTPELLYDATRSGLQQSWTGSYEFNLGSLELKSGDSVTYSITARDNRPPLGNQSRTGTLTLQIDEPVSTDEVKQRLQQDRQLQQQQLEQREPSADPPADSQNPAQTNPNDDTERPSPQTADQKPDPQAESSDSKEQQSPSDSPSSMSPSNGSNAGTDSATQQNGQGQDSDSSASAKVAPEEGSSEDSKPSGGQNQDPADGTSGSEPSSREGDEQQPDGMNSAPTQSDSRNGSGGEDRNDTARNSPPADDIEALQRLLDNYRKNPPAGETSQQPNDSSDSPSTGTDSTVPQQTSEQPSTTNAQGSSESTEQTPPEQTPPEQTLPEKPDGTADPKNKMNGQDNSADSATTETDSGKPQSQNSDPGSEDAKNESPGNAGTTEQSSPDDRSRPGDAMANEDRSKGESGQDSGTEKSSGAPGDGLEKKSDAPENRQPDNSSNSDGRNSQPADSKSEAQPNAQNPGSNGQQNTDQQPANPTDSEMNSQQGQQGGQQGQQGGQQGQQGGQQGQQGGQQGQQGGQQGQQPGQQGQQGQQGQPSGQKGLSGGRPGAAQSGNTGGGSGGDSGYDGTRPDDVQVTDAAQAADLVLKRLKQDLDRGTVDQDLLNELGWSEDQLKAFQDRMQQQLETLKQRPDADARSCCCRSEQLQQQRVQELLKSLNLKDPGQDRIGRSENDVERQDTTARQSAPPARYRDRLKQYQRSLSEGRRTK